MGPKNRLTFSKLEALGNDFVLIDGRVSAPEQSTADIARLADRRRGIGFDQMLVLRNAPSADHHCQVRIHNADGSRAEQCGNGMRAVILWLYQAGEIDHDVRLLTDGGSVIGQYDSPRQITVSLGQPAFDDEPAGRRARVLERDVAIHQLSLGNPHAVIEWPKPPSGDDLERTASQWGDGNAAGIQANLGLAHVAARDRIVLRVFERGAGATPACGSGACAAAVALIRAGRVDSGVAVEQPGGTLVIHWESAREAVRMTGPARRVFDGHIGAMDTP